MGISELSISIKKPNLKFSAGHMTVFGPTQKEALHGHNYTTNACFKLRNYHPDHSIAEMVPYADLKAIMKRLCDAWDEKVLIAEKCPYLEVVLKNSTEIEFKLCGSRYVLPASEVVLLPVDNITTESLAFVFSQKLAEELNVELWKKVSEFSIQIEESPGQGASYNVRLAQ
jgi:6-pyruvoyltetrahydropterin/6-carboxytetrahydropterin synthase